MKLRAVATALGSVYVPDEMPDGAALFYTGRDFEGFLTSEAIGEIRRFIRESFAISAPLSTCSQVHGTALAHAVAGSGSWCEFEKCDALWSDARPAALGIKVADCLPVTLVADRARVIANVHAGWRGASAGIVARTLDLLSRDALFSTTAARAYLGPSIRRCCFEVGEEVVEAFSALDDDAASFVDRGRGTKPHFDIAGFVAAGLIRRGFAPEAVFDAGICTRCDERFHSFRRDREKAGRNLAIVAH